MKKLIQSTQAPQAIGTYSQAIQVGNTVYLSGQIPLDPLAMTLINSDFKQQVIQVFNNLQAVTMAAGGGLDDIVKLTIYLIDLKNFAIVNEIMSELFKKPYPARTTIAVSALPKEAQIEIDAIMIVPTT